MTTIRAKGGRFARAVAPPPVPDIPDVPAKAPEPTATERLAELEACRVAGGGYILPRPADLDEARILPPPIEARGGPGLAQPNAAMQRAEAWFREIAAIGSPNDLSLAWETWCPPAPAGAGNPKPIFEHTFLQLCDECGRRFDALWQEAQREAARERDRIQHRDHGADLRRQLDAARCEVDRIKGLLARHESLRPHD